MAIDIPNGPYDAFVSYGGPDEAWARTLREQLTALGLRVFFCPSAISAGDNFVTTIGEALRQSRFLVVVLSHVSVGRQWVVAEYSHYIAMHGPLGNVVPVRLDDVALPAVMAAIQAVDAKHRDAARVAAEIMTAVGKLATLPDGDVRRLVMGQQFSFVVSRDEPTVAQSVEVKEDEEAGASTVTPGLWVTGPSGDKRVVPLPWVEDTAFTIAHLEYGKHAARPVEDDLDRQDIHRHATTVGSTLFGLLFRHHTRDQLDDALSVAGGQRPLVTIVSDDDLLLSLPWELLCHDGEFLVREGRVDLVRTTPGRVAVTTLPDEPDSHLSLVVTVSAPEGSGLDHEGESYRITKALAHECEFHPTELGTADDLVDTVRRHSPMGIHFSGHGAPGVLQFEDEYGRRADVDITELVARLEARLPDDLPPFFYLASCHGNEPGQPVEDRPGSSSSAATLHRQGVAQVVGYYGPIADELSTRAEVAIYRAIGEGQSTRYAVRQARNALLGAAVEGGDLGCRPAGLRHGTLPSQVDVGASTHPFAWAQLVLYQRGVDHPLSKPGTARRLDQAAVPDRQYEPTGDERRRVLSAGFVGRRSELHKVRRAIRDRQRVFVFQGLGGLGKSTLAFRSLPLIAGEGALTLTLWCHEVEDAPDKAVALVDQLLAECRRWFGAPWESVVQAVDVQVGEDPVARFLAFLDTVLSQVPELVLNLDNLESLLVGPGDAANGEAFGEWRDPTLGQLWGQLVSRATTGKRPLAVVASCRYRHDDFARYLFPVSPMARDAHYRMMSWFSALRRLSPSARAGLVERLAGHPRAVEFTNDLIQDAIDRWEDTRGPWQRPDDPEEEWSELVKPALPKVQGRLRGDLLLQQLWHRVLDDRARRMLFRLTLPRRPCDWDLMLDLGEADEPREVAEQTAERLRRTSLIEQVEMLDWSPGQEGIRPAVRFSVHPSTASFVCERLDDDEVRLSAEAVLGDVLAERAKTSPLIETHLDAGHHLFEAGELDGAYEMLGTASDWLRDHGRVREGLEILLRFVPIANKLKRNLAGRLLTTLGLAHADLGEVAKAIGNFEQHLVIAREIGDRRVEGIALGNLGSAYLRLGEVANAIALFEQHLAIAHEIGDRPSGATLGNLGSAYLVLGEVAKAIGHFEQHIVIAREVGDRRGEGNSLGNLGTAHLRLGDVVEAIRHFERHIVIAREIGDRHGEGNSLGNLGSAYVRLGEVTKAIGHLEQRLVIARDIGDRWGEGAALVNLGRAYLRLGEVPKAIGNYEQSLVIAREIGNRRGEGFAIGNLGIAYAALEEVAKAIEFLERARAIGREIGDADFVEDVSETLLRLKADPKDISADT